MTLLLDLEIDSRSYAPNGFFHAWLSQDGVTVGFIKGRALAEDLYGTDDNENYLLAREGVWLYDIEIREGYRNRGLSKELLKMTATHFGKDVIKHSGGYTPEGWDYLAKNLTRPANAEKVDGPAFRSQTFVHDWDERYAKNC